MIQLFAWKAPKPATRSSIPLLIIDHVQLRLTEKRRRFQPQRFSKM